MKQLSLQRKHKEALVQIAEGRQQGLDLDVIKELTAAGFKVGDRVVVVHKEEYEKLLEGWCSGECKTIRGDSDSGGLGCSVRRPEERKSPR